MKQLFTAHGKHAVSTAAWPNAMAAYHAIYGDRCRGILARWTGSHCTSPTQHSPVLTILNRANAEVA